MIKCKNKCPLGKFEGCCKDCPEQKCEDACPSDPATCGDSTYEGSTDLEVFQAKQAAIIKTITGIVTQKKALEDQEKTLKEKLQQAMEQHGVKSFDNDVLKITYVAESVRSSVDSAKLKKNYPDIAAECSKSSPVKAFVKVEVK